MQLLLAKTKCFFFYSSHLLLDIMNWGLVGMVKEVAAINLEGDFSQVRYFRKAYMMCAENIHRYVINLLKYKYVSHTV